MQPAIATALHPYRGNFDASRGVSLLSLRGRHSRAIDLDCGLLPFLMMMRGIQADEEGLLHAFAVELAGAVKDEGARAAGGMLGVIYVEAKMHSLEVVSA